MSGNLIIDKGWWSGIKEIAENRIKTIHEKHPELPGIDISELRNFMKKEFLNLKFLNFSSISFVRPDILGTALF